MDALIAFAISTKPELFACFVAAHVHSRGAELMCSAHVLNSWPCALLAAYEAWADPVQLVVGTLLYAIGSFV